MKDNFNNFKLYLCHKISISFFLSFFFFFGKMQSHLKGLMEVDDC